MYSTGPWVVSPEFLHRMLCLQAIGKAEISFDKDGLDPSKTLVCYYNTPGPEKEFYFTLFEDNFDESLMHTLINAASRHEVIDWLKPFSLDNLGGRYFLDLYAKLESDLLIYCDTNSSKFKCYKIALNLGSLYGPGFADAEDLVIENLSIIEYLASNWGYKGVVAWVAYKRESIPDKYKEDSDFKAAYSSVYDLHHGSTLIRDIRERRFNVTLNREHLHLLNMEDERVLSLMDKAAEACKNA